jgi:cation:H+ antiporter
MINFFLFLIFLALVIKSVDFSIRYSVSVAEGLRLPKYLIGFLLIAVISVLPEAFISIASAIQNTPAFGLGTLFGSNVADLTLVFAIVVFASRRNVKVESQIIKNNFLYILALLVPLLFGFDGAYSRAEGILLIATGIIFYFLILSKNKKTKLGNKEPFSWVHLFYLLLSMAVLLLASIFAVKFGLLLASDLKVNPILIGMLFVGLGTTLPELIFSLKATRKKHDSLALGDILGTVITDATIIVGLLAVIRPFVFPSRIVFVTGIFMVAAVCLLLRFMKTGKVLNKKEALCLLLYYLFFVLIEFILSHYFGH